MTYPKGYKCPVCGIYADVPTKVIKHGKGWIRFIYGCGHQTMARPKTIGRLGRWLYVDLMRSKKQNTTAV